MSYRKVYPGWLKGRVGRSLRGDADSYTLAYYLMTAEENVKGLGLFWQPLECVAVLYGLPMDRLSVAVETLRSLRFGAYDAESEWWFVAESARHEWGEQPNLAARAVQGMRPTLFDQLDSCRKSFVFKSWMLRYALPWADILGPLRTATDRLSIAYRETIDPPEPSPDPDPLPEPDPDPYTERSSSPPQAAAEGENPEALPPPSGAVNSQVHNPRRGDSAESGGGAGRALGFHDYDSMKARLQDGHTVTYPELETVDVDGPEWRKKGWLVPVPKRGGGEQRRGRFVMFKIGDWTDPPPGEPGYEPPKERGQTPGVVQVLAHMAAMDPPLDPPSRGNGISYGAIHKMLGHCNGNADRVCEIIDECDQLGKLGKSWGYLWTLLKEHGENGMPKRRGNGRSGRQTKIHTTIAEGSSGAERGYDC